MDAVPWSVVLRRGWRTVLGWTLAGVLVSVLYATLVPPAYTASTTLFFSPSSGSTASELNQGTAYTQNLVRSFAQVADAEQVLGPVVRRLDLDTTPARLARSVSARTAPDSLLLTVSVVGPDAVLAARTANAVAEELTTVVAELSPVSRTTNRTIRVTTVAEAQVPDGPSNRFALLLLAGPVLGLLLGLAVAGVRELLDDRVRTAKQLRDVTELDLLGTVDGPRSETADRDEAPSEQVRRLGTNLLAALQRDGSASVLVTAAAPSAASASAAVAVDLAVGLTERGLRVVLVDADLRSTAAGARLGLPSRLGLTDVVSGSASLRAALRPWGERRLQVLSAGSPLRDPGALLPTPGVTALVRELEQGFDVVLVHGAPVLPAADAGVLSRQVSVTVVVADSSRTTRRDLRRALAELELAAARVLGIVLTASGSTDRTPRRGDAAPGDGGVPAPPPVARRRKDARREAPDAPPAEVAAQHARKV